MKKKINYINNNSKSLRNYFVFCKRSKLVRNSVKFIPQFLTIFKHFKAMFVNQIISVMKSLFITHYKLNTYKLLGAYKESNLKDKFNQKTFIIKNIELNINTDFFYFLFFINLNSYLSIYKIFILLLLNSK